MSYTVNEIFYSIQGEGVRAGVPHVFVRFSGCNLQCAVGDEHSGFDCDTEFTSGRRMEADELIAEVQRIAGNCRAVILTGGEPTLQLDADLCAAFRGKGFYLALETNGTRQIPLHWVDWITVSPKSAEHTIRQRDADEVKYVRQHGQGIPKTVVEADHYLISPAFDASGQVNPATLAWCVELVKENPQWRMSMQQHKLWNVR